MIAKPDELNDNQLQDVAIGGMFRRLFCAFPSVFVVIAMTVNYAPWSSLPLVGRLIDSAFEKPITLAAGWSLAHIIHLTGLAAMQHATDSRDTAYDWASMVCEILFSLAIAAALAAFNRKWSGKSDRWFRYAIRMMLVFVMLRYAIFKIFPLQMSHPSLAILNEPLGQSSRMSLLWTLIGVSPAYQIGSGILEGLCALLLLFRRTALAGTLFGIAVMSHVVLLNFCFNVPVKLGAILILFAFLTLVAPDVPALCAFFFRARTARASSAWSPEFDSVVARRLLAGFEVIYIACALYMFVPPAYIDEKQETAELKNPSTLSGEWHVQSAVMTREGKSVDAPVLTAELQPMTDLYIEPDGRAMARSADGRLWRAGVTIDQNKRTLALYSYYFEGQRFQATYQLAATDAEHLQLAPTGPDKGSESTLTLAKVPLATHYPLLEDRFHWVQEWATER